MLHPAGRPGEWKEGAVNLVTSPSLSSDLVRPTHTGDRAAPAVSVVGTSGVPSGGWPAAGRGRKERTGRSRAGQGQNWGES